MGGKNSTEAPSCHLWLLVEQIQIRHDGKVGVQLDGVVRSGEAGGGGVCREEGGLKRRNEDGQHQCLAETKPALPACCLQQVCRDTQGWAVSLVRFDHSATSFTDLLPSLLAGLHFGFLSEPTNGRKHHSCHSKANLLCSTR